LPNLVGTSSSSWVSILRSNGGRPRGSDYTAAQFLEVEEGVYENGVWKTTDTGSTSQDDYTGPTVRLPARGAMMRVKLMKY
jgi:hypothetical protein